LTNKAQQLQSQSPVTPQQKAADVGTPSFHHEKPTFNEAIHRQFLIYLDNSLNPLLQTLNSALPLNEG